MDFAIRGASDTHEGKSFNELATKSTSSNQKEIDLGEFVLECLTVN